MERFIIEYVEILDMLTDFFPDRAKQHEWMHTENPGLGNAGPVFLISIGKADKVKRFIETSLDDNGRIK